MKYTITFFTEDEFDKALYVVESQLHSIYYNVYPENRQIETDERDVRDNLIRSFKANGLDNFVFDTDK
jgi:hypothetical protein